MRILLVNNHCITDPTCGVTQSLRTLMEWLAEAGHQSHILTTSRFESAPPFTIQDLLRAQRVLNDGVIVHYQTGSVPVTLMMGRYDDENRPHHRESEQYIHRAVRLMHVFGPDVVIACNGHPMIRTVLQIAKERGITTVFALRGYGYDRSHFEHVDSVFTCSRFLSDHYKQKFGLDSTPIPPPIKWSEVVTLPDERQCVTFVHPAPHKGLMVFLRLADMLHRRRPDIPLLVVESSRSMARFGLDQATGVHAMDPTPTPAGWLRYTKILLVPSVWDEPFGRVAAEAMINGIPAIVSDRGGLPGVVKDAGSALSLPTWMTPDTFQLPAENETESWYQSVCALWDEPLRYEQFSAVARIVARTCYSEDVSRRAHVGYLEGVMAARHSTV